MSESDMQARLAAERVFQRARARAFVERVVGQLRGRPTDLLPFEQVRSELGLLPSSDRGLREIALDHIVGSQGRYLEFTRSFLPRKTRVRERWKRVYAATEGEAGVPPIEVYQVGDVYFVKDGNHRVSVAREMGAKTIQAYVTEFTSPVPLPVDTDLDDVILRAEKVRFLQQTHLDELHPETPIEVTWLGCYDKLAEHIAAHGYFLGKDQQRNIGWQEAVNSWYENVYMPMVRIIREQDILKDFPGRTEADLYLWIMEHRHYLAEELGQEIDRSQAAEHFAEQYSPRLQRTVERAGQTLADILTPAQLEPGPTPGRWRAERVRSRGEGPLFRDILLPVDGSSSAWCALEQTVAIAGREQGRLYGLYVAAAEASPGREEAVRQELARRCEQRGVSWKWIAEGGDPVKVIAERAHWADLIVLGRQGDGGGESEHGVSAMVEVVARHAVRPVLVALETCSLLSKALLAYDGSPESEEALFVAAYLGQRWGLPLAVVTVEESRRADEGTLHRAVTYLNEHGVQAKGMLRRGEVTKTILVAAQECGCDWLVMGGSGYSPFGTLFTRSTVQRVLREAPFPVLICR
jgi:nucleotide-binding universal stress UspA family protein